MRSQRIDVWPLLNDPEGNPGAGGAVNPTFTPLTGLLLASLTVTASAFANAVLTAVD